jgi:hypothetical protein
MLRFEQRGKLAELPANLVDGFDDLVMETACGLHNLRIDHPMTA